MAFTSRQIDQKFCPGRNLHLRGVTFFPGILLRKLDKDVLISARAEE